MPNVLLVSYKPFLTTYHSFPLPSPIICSLGCKCSGCYRRRVLQSNDFNIQQVKSDINKELKEMADENGIELEVDIERVGPWNADGNGNGNRNANGNGIKSNGNGNNP
jgi:hypothetical protein